MSAIFSFGVLLQPEKVRPRSRIYYSGFCGNAYFELSLFDVLWAVTFDGLVLFVLQEWDTITFAHNVKIYYVIYIYECLILRSIQLFRMSSQNRHIYIKGLRLTLVRFSHFIVTYFAACMFKQIKFPIFREISTFFLAFSFTYLFRQSF